LIQAPVLIQLEQEIEEEIKADKIMSSETHEGKREKPAPAIKERPVIKVDMMSLDEMVG